MSLSHPNENGFSSLQWMGRSKLFHRWLSHKPVFIDFGAKLGFWRIARFDPTSKKGVIQLVDRESFSKLASSGTTDFSKDGGPASR